MERREIEESEAKKIAEVR